MNAFIRFFCNRYHADVDTRMHRNLARATAAIVVMLALTLWQVFSPPVALGALQVWINTFGSWGPVVFFFFYVVAVVLLIPGSVLALIAGLAYGAWGLPIALGAATTGATISFFVARHLARGQIQYLTRRYILWHAVESAISSGGWRIVGLLRFSPLIPFNLLNYFLGITRIRFHHYLPATLVGIFPGTAVNVSFAAAGQAITLGGLWHPVNAGLFILGMLVTVAAGWAIQRRVHVMLTRHRLVKKNTISYSYRLYSATGFGNFKRVAHNVEILSPQ